jgi:CIC family chloride channel protein
MHANGIVSTFLRWRIKHVSNKNFVLILSVIVGVGAGLAAVTLKSAVHSIHHFLSGNDTLSFSDYWYITYPFIGLFITFLISHFIFKERLGHGISNILYIINNGSSKIKPSMTFSRMITSAITVGFGGSVGLEAPIVVTGSAIGSNIARQMHLNYKYRTLLLGCGAAGAVAGIFNSPIAGVIFVIEVIVADIAIDIFIPLLLASVSGATISHVLLGEEILFKFDVVEHFTASEIPFYLLLGIACGLVALHFTRMQYYFEGLVHKIKNDYTRLIVSGSLLALLVAVLPGLYGEGYTTIKELINGEGANIVKQTLFLSDVYYNEVVVLLAIIVALIMVKAIATALTIGSGGSGGIFAPSLMIGALTGYLIAIVINHTSFLGVHVSPANFALVGMCGVFSGVLHAPLTGIFLIAEITGGYALMIPLMLVSAIAYVVISYFEPYSIYTKHLVERGDLVIANRDKMVLSKMNMFKLIEKDFKTVHPDAFLGDLIDQVKVSKRNIFPVVDSECGLVGVVTLDDVRHIMFDSKKQNHVIVRTIMHIPKEVIQIKDDMETVMGKFETSGKWNLPVVNGEEYIGFISKSSIFSVYRQSLKKHQKQSSLD